MKQRNSKKATLAKRMSEALGVSVNMAYKYIRGYSSLSWEQAKTLKNKRVISYRDLENIDSYLNNGN